MQMILIKYKKCN